MTDKIYGATKPSLEDALEHHGVKGQRWGQHIKGHPGQSQHQLNKQSRQADRQARKTANANYNTERNKTIDQARLRVSTGQTRASYKEAKAQYKIDKQKLGRREAKKKLHVAKIARNTDHQNAQLTKSGAETTGKLIGALGGVAISTLVQASGRPVTQGPTYRPTNPRAPYRTTATVGPRF